MHSLFFYLHLQIFYVFRHTLRRNRSFGIFRHHRKNKRKEKEKTNTDTAFGEWKKSQAARANKNENKIGRNDYCSHFDKTYICMNEFQMKIFWSKQFN